jgi:phenylacetate-CoA ligase
MLIIRGVNVFPTQIEEIVLAHEKLSGQYLIKVGREGHLDSVELHCEVQAGAGDLGDAEREQIAQWVQQRVKTMIGISTTVLVKRPDSIERTLTGKARRVVDERPKT